MRRLAITTLVTLAALAGCATPHLGPNTGDATRAAFAAQADRKTRAAAPLDAVDAHLILLKHRTKLRVGTTSATGGGAGGGAVGAGAAGQITLEAK